MEEAMFLTRFASRVHLIHRRKEFRATKIMLDRAHANEKIHFVTPAVIEDISDVDKDSVETVPLRDPETGKNRNCPWRAFLWPSATNPTPRFFAPFWTWTRTDISPPATAARPISKEFLPPAMCRTTTIGRRSPLPVPVAWRPWMLRNSWKQPGIKTRLDATLTRPRDTLIRITNFGRR